MSLAAWLAAGLLGGCGALLRFLVDGAVSSRIDRDFPYGTLLVNLSGSVLLGLIVGLAVGGDTSVLLGSATIGAYTTFSTWMLESQRLAEDGESSRAVVNLFLSLALGLLAAALGRSIGTHL